MELTFVSIFSLRYLHSKRELIRFYENNNRNLIKESFILCEVILRNQFAWMAEYLSQNFRSIALFGGKSLPNIRESDFALSLCHGTFSAIFTWCVGLAVCFLGAAKRRSCSFLPEFRVLNFSVQLKSVHCVCQTLQLNQFHIPLCFQSVCSAFR